MAPHPGRGEHLLARESHAMKRAIRVALAGNPNSGKSSIFNALTGTRQRVGNYPGVTVERHSGPYRHADQAFAVEDLPGTYSLSSLSPEERVAQRVLTEERPDVVVAVIDASNLKRNLVLLTQLLQLDVPLVVCLNMWDEAERAGLRLNCQRMESLLGCFVVRTVAHRGAGLEELREAIASTVSRRPRTLRLASVALEGALDTLGAALAAPALGIPCPRWVAGRLLIGDRHIAETVRKRAGGEAAVELAESRRRALEVQEGAELSVVVAHAAYGYVDGLLREVVEAHPREDARAVTAMIDHVMAHRLLGLPIFLAMMYGVFWLTFRVGELPMGWIEAGFARLGMAVSSLWPAHVEVPLRSLLVDGVIGGVGGVLVFLPNIVLLFLALALLEDSGYMARAAFLMDRLMRAFGLHGRSFVPLVSGFGCSIPAIMATRTIENERERLTTMLVLPLMSCGARLPIWLLLVPAFFPASWRAPALWAIYLFGVGLALTLARLLRSTLLRGDETPFVMELPPYRIPTGRAVVLRILERSWLYLRKAGTIILAISILMWFATSYPKAPSYQVDREVAGGGKLNAVQISARRASEDLKSSVAGRIGTFLEPALRPLGFDWKLGTAMVGAFAAKEVFVAQLGIVHAMGATDEKSTTLRASLAQRYSPRVAISLILFLLIATPCMATFAITRRESGSWRWAFLQLGGLTVVAYALSLAFYQLSGLLT